MTVDLRFRRALGPQPGGAVALRFGAAESLGTPDPTLRLRVRLPWLGAAPQRVSLGSTWSGLASLLATWRCSWAAASALRGALVASWQTTAAIGNRWGIPWPATAPVLASVRAPWRPTTPAWRAWLSRWQAATPQRMATAAAWQSGTWCARSVSAPWQGGQAERRPIAAIWSVGAPQRQARMLPWGPGGLLVTGGGSIVVVPPPVPPVGCWQPEPGGMVSLLFRRALGPQPGGAVVLRFGCGGKPAVVVVPVRRVYIVSVSGSLVRVDNGVQIPALSISLALDADSWTWDFSATVTPGAKALLARGTPGVPVVLEATLSGEPVRVVVEGMGRTRVFGRDALQIKGRGINAALAAPYSAVSTFGSAGALTSQQLLDAALPDGWSASWGLDPWLVPAGAWSHQGTPMTAALAIAGAGGGYVQPHPTAPQILVLPRYPVAPWEWSGSTPDIELPADVVKEEAWEWLDQPGYNRVYVCGSNAGGLLASVTRSGTAGDVEAPMVVDPLITHATAARQRGLAILADTGRQAFPTLRLRLLPGVGIIRPGRLLRYIDGGTSRVGLSRGVRVVYGGGADLWQHVRVETRDE